MPICIYSYWLPIFAPFLGRWCSLRLTLLPFSMKFCSMKLLFIFLTITNYQNVFLSQTFHNWVNQITLASFSNLEINSSTSLTITPPFFFGGSVVSTILTLEFSILRESSSTSYILAFLAFIMAGIDAILGVLSLKSQVITAGPPKLIVCNPESI